MTHFARAALAAAAAMVAFAGLAAQASAQTAGQKLTASLNGANEKPTAGDPKATGTATITVNPGQVCYDLAVKDLAQPTMAHIHKGGPNDAGGVALALTPPDASGKSQACVTADAALTKDLVANPGGYYVNVHSAQFKAGAIRGQLGK
jgi:Cu/Zn superoxide dismutase